MEHTSTVTSNDDHDKFQYQSKERDTESGYDYFEARLYDSATGRFLQADPHGERYVHTNSYSGMNNNPMMFVDPDGMDAIKTAKEMENNTASAKFNRKFGGFKGKGSFSSQENEDVSSGGENTQNSSSRIGSVKFQGNHSKITDEGKSKNQEEINTLKAAFENIKNSTTGKKEVYKLLTDGSFKGTHKVRFATDEDFKKGKISKSELGRHILATLDDGSTNGKIQSSLILINRNTVGGKLQLERALSHELKHGIDAQVNPLGYKREMLGEEARFNLGQIHSRRSMTHEKRAYELDSKIFRELKNKTSGN